MIPATTMMQKIKQEKHIFLVDIRHEAQFSKFKIPGSINIPLSFIKTKPFLKTKPIVIIHEGFGYSQIIQEATPLKEKGFDIKILEGGLVAWKHIGGAIVGDPFTQKDLNKMPARAFFMEKDYEEWIILNACRNPSETQKKIIPKAIHTPEKIPDIVQAIFTNKPLSKQKITVPRNTPLAAVIIFNETGKDYDKLEKEINKTFAHKVFFLEGGIEAYQTFLNYQRLANKPISQRTKEIGHCEPCKKKDNQ